MVFVVVMIMVTVDLALAVAGSLMVLAVVSVVFMPYIITFLSEEVDMILYWEYGRTGLGCHTVSIVGR